MTQISAKLLRVGESGKPTKTQRPRLEIVRQVYLRQFRHPSAHDAHACAHAHIFDILAYGSHMAV